MAQKTAEELSKFQREISVSEFFEKNKHLLGFDNPTKALLIIVKEGVDNSLDACSDARILPTIKVNIRSLKDDKYKIVIQDNGPGIVREQVGKIFGKLLYGSKFHQAIQSRGQQGIGISAAILYSQLTSGVPIKIYSKIQNRKKTGLYKLLIDTKKNAPKIIEEKKIKNKKLGKHGIRLEFKATARYRKTQGPAQYLKETAIGNPFATIKYSPPSGKTITYKRAVNELPPAPKKINPHPYGVELGVLLRMLDKTKSRTIASFLQNEFSSVGRTSAGKICKKSKISMDTSVKDIGRKNAETLLKNMQKIKLQSPPLDCLSPIGEKALKEGLKKIYPEATFVETETRSTAVYRGNPFQIETGIVYDPENFKPDSKIKLIRFANRVPLLYQQGACAIYNATSKMNWKIYNLKQSNKSLPIGPVVVAVHMCSVWVPFISESKEAVASYPQIIKEMKLGLQSCARKLRIHLNKKKRAKRETKRLHIFEDYFPLIAESAQTLAETKKDVNITPILNKVVKKDLVEDDG